MAVENGPASTHTRVRTILAIRTCDAAIQGPESLILTLAEIFRSRQVRYVIVNLWDGDPPQVALHETAVTRGLESHVIATRWGMSPMVIPRLLALIRHIRPDIVHTHDVKAEFAAVVASRLSATPLIGSFYGRLAMHSLLLKGADLMRFPVFRRFDRVLANSEAQSAELREFRVPAERIEVVPSFVDTQALRPASDAEAAGARARLGVPPAAPVLATVGKLVINKGHRDMLQALATVRATHPDVIYLVPGEGENPWRGEGGLRGELESLARTLGVADNVRFLGYYPDIPTVLHASDILVSPSLREGMQVALLEGMACGLPIVATAIGGTPDAVADGESGLLVSPSSPPALAAAVLELLGDRRRLRDMGEAGRRRAETRFDTRVVAEKVLRICDAALSARANGATASDHRAAAHR
jgi:glycosyltransferase involved in cell wall biosynthesis